MFTPEQLLANSQTRLRDAIAERKAAQDELLALRDKLESGDDSITRDMVTSQVALRDAADARWTTCPPRSTRCVRRSPVTSRSPRFGRRSGHRREVPVLRPGGPRRCRAAHLQPRRPPWVGVPDRRPVGPGEQRLRRPAASRPSHGRGDRRARRPVARQHPEIGELRRSGRTAVPDRPVRAEAKGVPSVRRCLPPAPAAGLGQLSPSRGSPPPPPRRCVPMDVGSVETNIDDTALDISVQEIAGAQSLSRKAVSPVALASTTL